MVPQKQSKPDQARFQNNVMSAKSPYRKGLSIINVRIRIFEFSTLPIYASLASVKV